jgi:hypothetical protein
LLTSGHSDIYSSLVHSDALGLEKIFMLPLKDVTGFVFKIPYRATLLLPDPQILRLSQFSISVGHCVEVVTFISLSISGVHSQNKHINIVSKLSYILGQIFLVRSPEQQL